MARDAEFAVIAITREAAGLQGARNDRDRELGRIHLQEIHGRLEVERVEAPLLDHGGVVAPQSRHHRGPQHPQRRGRARQMGRARRQLSAVAARGLAHEQPRALGRARGDSRPYGAPGQMSDRHHGVGVDLLIRLRQDLFGLAGGLEPEARAAGAAHAERVPGREMLQAVILPEQSDQDLIGGRRLWRPARGRDDAVGLRPIGHHGGAFAERKARALLHHGAIALAQIAAALALGGRGREQQLLVAQPPQQMVVPCAGAGMADEARHHDLMHRIDHRNGTAGAAEHVADVDHFGDACALAAELDRNEDSEQALRPDRRKRFGRESCLGVDRAGMGRGDGRRRLRAPFDVLGERIDLARRSRGRSAVRQRRTTNPVMCFDDCHGFLCGFLIA